MEISGGRGRGALAPLPLPLPTPTPTPTPTPNRKVRSRLFRTRWPWLLVFDNVSSARLVEQTGVLPRGCHGVGHVLVTSRHLSEASSSREI